MYVNYGLTVGLAIATFAISVLFFNLTLLESFIPIVIVLLLTTPITIRLSRIIWINIFVHFDKNATKRSKSDE